jgi:hypothetical protein
VLVRTVSINTPTGDVPASLTSLAAQMEKKNGTQVWCHIIVWNNNFGEDDHVQFIDSCELTT